MGCRSAPRRKPRARPRHGAAGSWSGRRGAGAEHVDFELRLEIGPGPSARGLHAEPRLADAGEEGVVLAELVLYDGSFVTFIVSYQLGSICVKFWPTSINREAVDRHRRLRVRGRGFAASCAHATGANAISARAIANRTWRNSRGGSSRDS